jgi:hypothetical protein
MGKNIAVNGCTLEITGGSGPAPTITSTPSTKVLAGNKGVFFGEIAFSVSGVTAGDIANSDGAGSGSIKGTGDNVLDGSGNKVVLEGDISAEITVNGTKPSQSGPVPASGKIKVKVSAAGQSVVIAS